MAVWVRQYNNGVDSGEERQIFPPDDRPDEPELTTLERKGLSHIRNGWTVGWLTATSFEAVKRYPEVGERRRRFWIA